MLSKKTKKPSTKAAPKIASKTPPTRGKVDKSTSKKEVFIDVPKSSSKSKPTPMAEIKPKISKSKTTKLNVTPTKKLEPYIEVPRSSMKIQPKAKVSNKIEKKDSVKTKVSQKVKSDTTVKQKGPLNEKEIFEAITGFRMKLLEDNESSQNTYKCCQETKNKKFEFFLTTKKGGFIYKPMMNTIGKDLVNIMPSFLFEELEFSYSNSHQFFLLLIDALKK